MPRPQKPRRTRAEADQARSLATRERLLRATFDSLVAHGYAGTTTVEICRRAKVERGTMLHHYPEREALIVAAVEYVFEQRLADLSRGMAEAVRARAACGKEPLPPVDEAIDLLWAASSGQRTTLAWLELIVASRTDSVLHRALTRMMRAFDERITEAFAGWFPTDASGPGAVASREIAQRFTFALMNGLVLDEIAGYGHAPAVVESLKGLARRLVRVGWDVERLP